MVDQNVEESPQRAKKRRLDHLTWEEKMQRKKLKNRVAAQTSRDRKKAKQEQMETAVQQLFNKNETLLAECERLKEANERLQAENTELHQRLQSPQCQCQNRTVVCAPESGSTERNRCGHSSGFDQRPQGGSVEDSASLPSLPDLLDELESDAVDLNALEQLTQTLLEDIARDLESAAEKAADQESSCNRKDNFGEVVGTPSKQLESSRTKVLDNKSLEQDISEYLLLHHNYAKMPPKESKIRLRKTPGSIRKLKNICPKVETKVKSTVKPNNLFENHVKLQESNQNKEATYGNAITILVDQDSTPLNEVIIDNSTLNTNIPLVIDTNSSLTVPKLDSGNLSPKSDLGYESLDSPVSNSDIDQWAQSVTELFPSLF